MDALGQLSLQTLSNFKLQYAHKIITGVRCSLPYIIYSITHSRVDDIMFSMTLLLSNLYFPQDFYFQSEEIVKVNNTKPKINLEHQNIF